MSWMDLFSVHSVKTVVSRSKTKCIKANIKAKCSEVSFFK